MAIKFELSPFVKTLIGIFLFIPTIKFYNYLLTEPLSYAFNLTSNQRIKINLQTK